MHGLDGSAANSIMIMIITLLLSTRRRKMTTNCQLKCCGTLCNCFDCVEIVYTDALISYWTLSFS